MPSSSSKAAWLLAAAPALLLLLLSAVSLAVAQPAGEPCPGPAGEPPANYTAADCPGGSCYAAPPNGCGSSSLSIIAAEIVPDRWPGGVNFTAACNAHDTCYYNLGTTKEQCDRAFLDALNAECDRAVRCVDVPVVGQQCGSNPAYDACKALADGYYRAVAARGQESFDSAQDEQQAHVDQCAA